MQRRCIVRSSRPPGAEVCTRLGATEATFPGNPMFRRRAKENPAAPAKWRRGSRPRCVCVSDYKEPLKG